MQENTSHRKTCVVWTTKEIENEKEVNEKEVFTDHSKFFEEGEDEKADALYTEILNKENTYCASLCLILKDSEG